MFRRVLAKLVLALTLSLRVSVICRLRSFKATLADVTVGATLSSMSPNLSSSSALKTERLST